jgi:catechol 2,3-dioxygenase-like lactoylglutathione lyase family enzyme
MDMKLEVLVVPVSDVDRAKRFYEKLGFRLSYRIVQLTSPGSECSIQIGEGITRVTPGTYQGIYLISSDLEATRTELIDRGVDVSEPFHFGPKGQTPGLDTARAD